MTLPPLSERLREGFEFFDGETGAAGKFRQDGRLGRG